MAMKLFQVVDGITRTRFLPVVIKIRVIEWHGGVYHLIYFNI